MISYNEQSYNNNIYLAKILLIKWTKGKLILVQLTMVKLIIIKLSMVKVKFTN